MNVFPGRRTGLVLLSWSAVVAVAWFAADRTNAADRDRREDAAAARVWHAARAGFGPADGAARSFDTADGARITWVPSSVAGKASEFDAAPTVLRNGDGARIVTGAFRGGELRAVLLASPDSSGTALPWIFGGLWIFGAAVALGRNRSRNAARERLRAIMTGSYAETPTAIGGGTEEDEETWLTRARDAAAATARDLRTEEQRGRAVEDAVHDGILQFDGEGRVVRSNEAFRRIVGAAELPPGSPYWKALNSGTLLTRLREALEHPERVTGAPETAEIAGKIYASRVLPLPGGAAGNSRYALVLRDATAQALWEKDRSDFVANASHELGTPLAVILGWTERLLDRPQAPENLKPLSVIERSARRMQALVRDLTELSRLESDAGRPAATSFDGAAVCRQALRRADDAAALKGLRLAYRGPQTATLTGWERDLAGALDNLVENAVKYSDAGTVTVSLDEEENGYRFSVTDEGPGIPPGLEDRVFDRFFVVHQGRSRDRGGTGLGLSLVKKTAEIHGGSVRLRSRAGKGSEFSIWTPKTAPAPKN